MQSETPRIQDSKLAGSRFASVARSSGLRNQNHLPLMSAPSLSCASANLPSVRWRHRASSSSCGRHARGEEAQRSLESRRPGLWFKECIHNAARQLPLDT